MLCSTQYMYRHNQVAKYIHWNILKDNQIPVPESWLKHKPVEVSTKGNIEILWDSYILTNKKSPTQSPRHYYTQQKYQGVYHN